MADTSKHRQTSSLTSFPFAKLSRLCFAWVARDCTQARPTMKLITNQNGTNSLLLNRLPPLHQEGFLLPKYIIARIIAVCIVLAGSRQYC